ncbi:Random slug protein 5 [Zea mays]|uniref:Random slug protein 5 n=1 Tax=Zea mays TaxID=4577 RepID=A0A317Y2J8_MAIZE|nr:Random slug protein 5 [Zea mays]
MTIGHMNPNYTSSMIMPLVTKTFTLLSMLEGTKLKRAMVNMIGDLSIIQRGRNMFRRKHGSDVNSDDAEQREAKKFHRKTQEQRKIPAFQTGPERCTIFLSDVHSTIFYEQISELKAALGTLSARGEKYCSEACLRRYLEARNWNVAKSRKMLEESLKWRAAYKPEDIRWPDVSVEAETGKMYRASFRDREGRTVVVMKPTKQNTSSHEGQIRFLVYTLENAIFSLPEGQEKMVIKIFLDPKSVEKVNFVYQKDEESMKVMYKYIDPEVLPVEFGGKSNVVYNHQEYSELMRQDDIKTASFWAVDAKTNHANPAINGTLVPEVVPQSSSLAAKAS